MKWYKEEGLKEGEVIGIKKGRQEGEVIGFEKGKKERDIAIARSLLKSKVDINIISASTGLTKKEIRAL
jgi:predicted transposase/invertase (TIGR01784 family)